MQLQKRIRDDKGDWKTVPMFNLPDLPLAKRVIEMAQAFLEQQDEQAAG